MARRLAAHLRLGEAACLGFAHREQFTRRFRAVFGLTPAGWLADEGS